MEEVMEIHGILKAEKMSKNPVLPQFLCNQQARNCEQEHLLGML